ncbi:MAG: DUF5615 family PIN-like protein [Anaerolineae bacterium]
MKILLDENMPDGLRARLRLLGHTVDSIGSLRLKGLANTRLYREVAQGYDLFFTKDREFAVQVRAIDAPGPVKVVLTTLRQQPEANFVASFMDAFAATDWSTVRNGGEWPA